MSKINNIKNTYKSLVIISVFALGLIFSLPQNAFAAYRFVGGGGGYTYIDDGNYGGGSNGGYDANSGNLTPVIYTITPSKVVSGSGSKTITIDGENFTPNSVAKFGSLERPTSYVNSNRLLMQLSANDINGSGEYLISVRNPNGEYSNVEIFTIGKSNKAGGNSTNSTGTVSGANTGSATNNLGANAVSSGIRLSGLMLWLIIAILILIVVMLWRKVFGEKERNKTLKHA